MLERIEITLLTAEEREQVSGGRFKRNGVIPGYAAPSVYYDDGINIQTSDPSTTNVVVNYV